MAKLFGAHCNQEVSFSSAVKCKKVGTPSQSQRRNYYYYIPNKNTIVKLPDLKKDDHISNQTLGFLNTELSFCKSRCPVFIASVAIFILHGMACAKKTYLYNMYLGMFCHTSLSFNSESHKS